MEVDLFRLNPRYALVAEIAVYIESKCALTWRFIDIAASFHGLSTLGFIFAVLVSALVAWLLSSSPPAVESTIPACQRIAWAGERREWELARRDLGIEIKKVDCKLSQAQSRKIEKACARIEEQIQVQEAVIREQKALYSLAREMVSIAKAYFADPNGHNPLLKNKAIDLGLDPNTPNRELMVHLFCNQVPQNTTPSSIPQEPGPNSTHLTAQSPIISNAHPLTSQPSKQSAATLSGAS
ncbi:hypothetical protein BOTBODRAFT_48920 [Botryobasidium botryosum FD-172 SS1]|uniref:Uncharacterized protein n=1 Tax=Botryobasidium botryosum (strain FD-172 SS1) TaxID=930990 RepID=A0A067LVL8_BOTB1|nr:hypothetical protein BOTBODRAFT_48920 [Botryobasidium botryosum FD-172 SS1]